MGVYIEGMEMPTNNDMAPTAVWVYPNGYAVVFKDNGKMKQHTQAVPVPPHGRLIDADAFAAEMKKRQDACSEWRDDIKSGGGYGTELYYRADSFFGAMCEAKLTLDKIPTIITASEGDKE